jgi:hypothetical protein
MADPTEVAAVLALLGPYATAEGWTEERVGALLDAGLTPNQIARDFWIQRSASTATMVDMSESGSSRKLSDINKNALAMAKMFRDAADDEIEDPPIAPRAVTTRAIRRV